MPCTTNNNLVQVAVRTLIKEIIATYEARRRKRRTARKCRPCEAREQEIRS